MINPQGLSCSIIIPSHVCPLMSLISWLCSNHITCLVISEDLEERVRSSRRFRRNSLHHTQMLESEMKTVKVELVGTLDHLQELRNVLRRSQQKAEERKVAMEKLAAGLR